MNSKTQQWRLLNTGEKLQAGDEWLDGTIWIRSIALMDKVGDPGCDHVYRRQLQPTGWIPREHLEKARDLIVKHHDINYRCQADRFCPVCSPDGKDKPYNEAFGILWETPTQILKSIETSQANTIPQKQSWIPLDPAQGGRLPTEEDADEHGFVLVRAAWDDSKTVQSYLDTWERVAAPRLNPRSEIHWFPLPKFQPIDKDSWAFEEKFEQFQEFKIINKREAKNLWDAALSYARNKE